MNTLSASIIVVILMLAVLIIKNPLPVGKALKVFSE